MATVKTADLASHRGLRFHLVSGLGDVVRRCGVPLADLSEEGLMKTACRSTGLSDWGSDGFREPLRRLLESLEGERRLTFVPRLWFYGMLLSSLTNRLRIQSELERHPEILEVPVRRPIFIIGMPRTGTTLLHRLLARDPSSRAFRYWELREPSPPPERETYDRDRRRNKLKQSERFSKKLLFTESQCEAIQAIHPVDADEPEECEHLFMNSFMSYTMATLSATVSRKLDYVQWLRAQDRDWVYREHRQQVQLLSWRFPGEPLVLKCPYHSLALDSLLKVYPDASLIWTHRDPAKQVASMCNNIALWMLLFLEEPHDFEEIGPLVVDLFDDAIRGALELRESADPARFYDLPYDDLVKDPIGSLRGIYAHFGYDWTGGAEETMRSWLQQDRQRKRGRNDYSADDFGLRMGDIRERFKLYQERFNIPVEQS